MKQAYVPSFFNAWRCFTAEIWVYTISVHPKNRLESAWLGDKPLFVSRWCTTRAQRMSSDILHIVLMRVTAL